MTNKTTSANDLVERVARAMFEQVESRTIEASAELSADPSLWLTWETANEPTREPYREQARAAIEAMQPADTITRLKAALEAVKAYYIDANPTKLTEAYVCDLVCDALSSLGGG